VAGKREVPRESLDALVAFAALAKRENVRRYLFGAQWQRTEFRVRLVTSMSRWYMG
jgi:hypothetical protein